MVELRTQTFKVPALVRGTPQCAQCADRLTEAVTSLYGVESALVDSTASTIVVTYDEEVLTEELLGEAAARAGLEITSGIEHMAYRVSGLDCPDCAAGVDRSVAHLDGVLFASLNFAAGVLLVEYESGLDPRLEIEKAVRAMGYGLHPLEAVSGPDEGVSALARHASEITTIAAGVLILLGWLLGGLDAVWAGTASAAAYGTAILTGGWLTLRRAVFSVRLGALDMNVLMSIAVIGAAAIGEWFEAAMVVFLYAVGIVLEARSLEKTRRSIRDLMGLAPSLARIRRSGEEIEVAPGEVEVGEMLIVKAGERVSLDGRVVRGESSVDESPVTGESIPVEKAVGDPVYAGTINASSLLEVEVTAEATDSTLARIIHLVEEAQAQKAPIQRLVDRFTRYYTPSVILLAALVAVVPPVVGSLLGADAGGFRDWFYRGLVVLVVSCPCALVISTPVAIVSAITRATRMGVLVKGGAFLEKAPSIRVLAMDKTGTLTRGEPEVVRVEGVEEPDPDRILRVAAALEAGSTHPIARAVTHAAGDAGMRPRLESFHDLAGKGVRAVIDGIEYAIGSPEAAYETGIPFHAYAETVEGMEAQGLTALVLSSGRVVLGVIGVADRVRPESARAVQDLVGVGIRHVVMLTGDNERTAEAIAAEAGVREVRARLMPEDKVDFVRELRLRHGPVAMVGDGVNDAPALAEADIGIAMGVAGSDTALETADIALMRDDLSVLPDFFRLGRRTVTNITQNVIFSVAVKLVVLLLAVTGVATLWMAVFADTGVALLVILNGLRLLRT